VAKTVEARQSDSGVAWTALTKESYEAKTATFDGAVKETALTAEQTAAADDLIASNITWVNQAKEEAKWDTGVADWVATGTSKMTYDEACIEPVAEVVADEKPAVEEDSWGLTNVHAAFEATELSMITTPFSAAVEAKDAVPKVDAVKAVEDSEGNVTTPAVPEVAA